MTASNRVPPRRRSPLNWPVHRWIFALVMLNLLWRVVRYGLAFPMWGDEAFIAVNFITRGFAQMIGPLDHAQIVPLGFLWANLAVSKLAGTSELALRCLPFVAGVASVLLFWRLALRLLGRHQALAAVAIFAASYYPVRYATEVKPYSLDLLVSLMITALTWWVWSSPRAAKRWLLFACFVTGAVWMSYPSVFVAGGAILALGWRLLRTDSRATFVWWLACGALLTASFAAMWFAFGLLQESNAPGIHESTGWARAFPPVTRPWPLIVWFFNTHTGNMMAYPVGGNHGGSTFTAILAVAGIVAMWRTRRNQLILLLSPLPLMFIAAAMKKYPYGDSARVLQHIAPAVCLLAGAGLLALLHRLFGPRGSVTGLRIAAVVMVVIVFVGIGRDLLEPTKKLSDAEAQRVARWLADHSSPHDQWVVFGAMQPLDYAPNLKDWGGSAARFRYDLLQYADVPILWAPPPARVPDPTIGGSTWLIMYIDNKAPFPESQAQQYLDALTARFGRPQHQHFALHQHKKEAVEIYHFTGDD